MKESCAEQRQYKVGIMTWTQWDNFGSLLQAVALKHAIEKKLCLGQVQFIDYVARGNAILDHKISFFQSVASAIKSRFQKKDCSVRNDTFVSIDRRRFFKSFRDDNFTYSERCFTYSDLVRVQKSYDFCLAGSDQIWSPLVFDPHFFLDFVDDNRKKICYGPSIGVDRFQHAHIKCYLTSLLSSFYELSCRELIGCKLLSRVTNKKVQHVCDPSLLLDASEWVSLLKLTPMYQVNNQSNVIFCYFLKNDPIYWEKVLSVAKQINAKVKAMCPVPQFAEGLVEQVAGGPKEFVREIFQASSVVTDSFHGTCFSIIFDKPFLVFPRFKKNSRDCQNSRIIDLLSLIGETKRWQNPIRCSNEKMFSLLNCRHVAANRDPLKKHIEQSLAYLSRQFSLFSESTHKESRFRISEYCSGCGTCVSACNNQAIRLVRNKTGFFEPIVDAEKCVLCRRCQALCPIRNSAPSQALDRLPAFSYRSSSSFTLHNSSSGGAAFDLGQLFLDEKYTVWGCAFNETTKEAYHIKATDKDQLSQFRGSKYLQSYSADAINELFKNARAGLKVAFFGTPCQVAGIDALLYANGVRDQALLVDLICHGVPSRLLFERYLHSGIRDLDIHRPLLVRFRDDFHWPNMFIGIYQDGKRVYHKSQRDDFYLNAFTSGYCYAKSCRDCPYRQSSRADLRIGDYWGPKFANKDATTSMIIPISERGEEAMRKCASRYGTLDVQDIDDYFRYQQSCNFQFSYVFDSFEQKLYDGWSAKRLARHYFIPSLYARFKGSLKRLYSRLIKHKCV